MEIMSLTEYITRIPKAELHLHIEGTFEPELMFKIAKRNGIKIDFRSVEELRAAYDFNNLQEDFDIDTSTTPTTLVAKKDNAKLNFKAILPISTINVSAFRAFSQKIPLDNTQKYILINLLYHYNSKLT